MKIKLSVIALSIFVVISCEFRKSVKKDFLTGLATLGDGLSCDNVYLSNGEQKLSRSSFIYGEKFYLNFENMEGFKKSEDRTFPGMQLLVVSEAGDTVLKNNDLYAGYTNGINISPLLLQTNITVADPIHSDNNYTLYINIWDKKGEGTYKAEMDFDVLSNDQIKIENKNVSYDEIYLFSQERRTVITDNNAKFNENIYMIFEGLEGFKVESGKVFPGLSIKAKDSEGEMILNEEDLIGESGMELSALNLRIAPSFIFKDSNIKSPVTCEIVIWDKKSESRIKASARLNMK